MTSISARRTRRGIAAAAAVLVALSATACSTPAPQEAGDDYPSQRLEWTVATGEGGGTDQMTRLLVEIVKEVGPYPNDIVVENREGGGGARGYGYVFGQAGNPYQMVSTSSSFIATPLQSDTGWGPEDFTPVAMMGRDYSLFLVSGDSGIETLEEFVEVARSRTVTIGSVGTVNLGFIIPTLFAEAADFEFQHVPFSGFGDLQTAMLSGTVDALTSEPTEVAGLLASGDLRALAYSGPESPTAFDIDYVIPTFGDAGYEIEDIFLPRGVVLPPDVDQKAVDWWIAAFKRVAESDRWKQYLADNLIAPGDMYGDDFGEYLAATTSTFEKILGDAGVLGE